MNIWTTLLGVFALWVFCCFAVAIQLSTVSESSWHLRFMRRAYPADGLAPKGNCSYFWFLFCAPIVGALMLTLTIIVKIVLPVIFLCYDWLIAPFTGRRARPFNKMYWREVFGGHCPRVHTQYVDLPGKRLLIPLLALAACLAWLRIGATLYVCAKANCRDDGIFIFESMSWVLATAVGITMIMIAFLVTGTLGRKMEDAWNFVSGKFCHPLQYKKSKE